MGKSAVRMYEKAMQSVGVDPSPDAKGIKQPKYMRKHSAVQTSPRLLWHQSCVRQVLAGRSLGSRTQVWEAFAEASRQCSARNPHPKRR